MTELPIDENAPRILIVEDEPKLGQLLIDYLLAANYAPTLINHGDKVLPYVRQTPPDLILLDIEMPGMNGFEFASTLRSGGSKWGSLPFIALSSHATPRDIERGRLAGFTDYVAKFNREDLLATLQQTLSNVRVSS